MFLSLEWYQWMTAALSALLIGLTKAGFGSGAGILAVPLMALALGADAMLPVLLPVLVCGDVFSIARHPGKADRRNLRLLIPGCAAGVVIGWVILNWLQQKTRAASAGGTDTAVESLLNPLVGGLCIGFVCVQVWRYFRESRLLERPTPYRPKIRHGLLLGTIAGITSTLSHAAGPLIALFLLPQKLDKRVFVGTSVTYFLFGNLIKFVPYSFQGMFSAKVLATSGVLLPAVVAGTFAGAYLNRKIHKQTFVLVIYAVTFATGLKLLFG